MLMADDRECGIQFDLANIVVFVVSRGLAVDFFDVIDFDGEAFAAKFTCEVVGLIDFVLIGVFDIALGGCT